ncbi:hypothetical protein [Nocardia sp. NPDC059229]|uniref:hypothetical protein n=1 Tax=Nocardia sp. NPDC059229 TaxID=3346778 RepID=UPI0036A51DBC
MDLEESSPAGSLPRLRHHHLQRLLAHDARTGDGLFDLSEITSWPALAGTSTAISAVAGLLSTTRTLLG